MTLKVAQIVQSMVKTSLQAEASRESVPQASRSTQVSFIHSIRERMVEQFSEQRFDDIQS